MVLKEMEAGRTTPAELLLRGVLDPAATKNRVGDLLAVVKEVIEEMGTFSTFSPAAAQKIQIKSWHNRLIAAAKALASAIAVPEPKPAAEIVELLKVTRARIFPDGPRNGPFPLHSRDTAGILRLPD